MQPASAPRSASTRPAKRSAMSCSPNCPMAPTVAEANTDAGQELLAPRTQRPGSTATPISPHCGEKARAVRRRASSTPDKVRKAWRPASTIPCGSRPAAPASPAAPAPSPAPPATASTSRMRWPAGMARRQGIRQKNWDACAFPLFTLHTSGHNPRPDQAGRWRQRLCHKFRYYPEKFGKVLCTGCGRCIRLCPAGMDLLADLQELRRHAATGRSTCRIAATPNAHCQTRPGPRHPGHQSRQQPQHLSPLPDARRDGPR